MGSDRAQEVGMPWVKCTKHSLGNFLELNAIKSRFQKWLLLESQHMGNIVLVFFLMLDPAMYSSCDKAP